MKGENLLAIDTATEKFSVALAAGNDTWLFEADVGLRHSELLMDSIDMLMHRAGLKPEELSAAVCMKGPGSFTGLRIGFSTVKGLALSLGIPYMAIPTLDCMARPFASWPGIVMPVIDAKKAAFFCALYRNGKRLCPDMDASPDEIAKVIEAHNADQITLIGPAASMLYEKLLPLGVSNIVRETDLRWGNAQTLLTIIKETGITPCNTDNSNGPEYIRKSDAELMRN